MGKKTFNMKAGIGKARHVISFHDGVKTHNDKSPFFDIRIFGNKRAAKKFTKGLVAEGFSESS